MTNVCVTGANGFIAAELIALLLQDTDVVVKATVRSLSEDKTHFLKALPGASERLRLFQSQLTSVDELVSIISDCQTVFHLASPVLFTAEDPERDIVQPAMACTQTVLSAVEKAITAQLIVTSSLAAVTNLPTARADREYSEADWNEEATIQSNAYRFSKTQSERLVWQWAETNPQTSVCTICPSMVLGVPLNDKVVRPPHLNFSNNFFYDLFVNNTADHNTTNGIGFVDVQSVARAHLLAFQSPQKSGGQRFLCSAENHTWSWAAEVIKNHFPDRRNVPAANPTGATPPGSPGFAINLSNSKIVSVLGLSFPPVEQSIVTLCKWFEALEKK